MPVTECNILSLSLLAELVTHLHSSACLRSVLYCYPVTNVMKLIFSLIITHCSPQMHPAGSVIRRTIRKSKMPQTKVQIIKREARKRWNRFCKTGRAKRIDIISRGLFPGSFFILTIIYWAYYLTLSDYYEYENRDT